MPKFDHFSFLAPFYERIFKTPETSRLVGLVNLPPDACLLDVGGGTGRIAKLFNNNACKVIIVDISFGMLKQAVLPDLFHGILASSESLPYPDASFERIIMVDALHHVADQAKTIAELVRVLKPGGRVVIEEPDIRHLGVKLVAFGEKVLAMRSHFLRAEEIKALAAGQKGIKLTIDRESYVAWVIIEKIK